MTAMDLFSSYCLTEPNSGSDSKAMKTFAAKVQKTLYHFRIKMGSI
jgi:alkylation response protein AidB-like acyl-CoA dehydrogenase